MREVASDGIFCLPASFFFFDGKNRLKKDPSLDDVDLLTPRESCFKAGEFELLETVVLALR